MKKSSSILAGAAIALFASFAIAQAPAPAPGPTGFKRTELQRKDLSNAGHEAVTTSGVFDPGGVVPKHTHPGEEIGYVQEGELTVEIGGAAAVKVKAGETFFIPAGTVHSATNATKGPTKVISTYVVEKGKPLATFSK